MGTNQRAQIRMSTDEVSAFLDQQRTATMATLGPDGTPHLVAMWYAVLDGEVWFETKTKAQKVVNLRRDPRITVMVEAGLSYDELRGVAIEGRAEVVEEPDRIFAMGVRMWERYFGPYSEDMKAGVDQMLNKRVAVRVIPERVRTWDHRKLGMPAMPVSGSTAEFL